MTTKTENKTEVPNKIINIGLDATMLDTFVSCPAKFNYRFNMNKSTITLAPALDRGIIVHTGLEGYYLGLKEKLGFNSALDRAIEAVNLAVLESDLDPNEITFLKNVLVENITFWKTADQRFEIVEVEKAFSYELYRDEIIRIIMTGKIDLLINDERYSNLPYDTKTYSRDFPVHRKTNQFCNYAYATGSNYLIVNRVGLQTSLSPEKKHKRVPLSYDSLFLEQWRQNVVKWAYFYLQCASENSWPLNDMSCDKYGRLCEYYSVCDSSGSEAKTYKLNVDFKTTEPWDVAKSLGLKK